MRNTAPIPSIAVDTSLSNKQIAQNNTYTNMVNFNQVCNIYLYRS